MRGAAAVLLMLCASLQAANPGKAKPDVELVALRSVAGWLRTYGTEGYVGADLARALGLAPTGSAAMLDARQRGFRSAAVLRVAQLLADDSVLFMVQGAQGEVTFYYSTLRAGLVRALLSTRGLVLPLAPAEAEATFRSEVRYWEDRAANRD